MKTRETNISLNRKDWKLILAMYFIYAIITIIDFKQHQLSFKQYLIFIITRIISTTICFLIILKLIIPKFILKKNRYFLLFSSVLVVLISIGIIDYIITYWNNHRTWRNFPKWSRMPILGFFQMTESVSFALGLTLTKKFHESQYQLINIEKKQKENELKLLRSQLEPHFLFNNLNNLNSLIEYNPEKAQEYIGHLSLIYRYLIKNKDLDFIELDKEIELAKNYISLIEIKYGDRYNFKFDIKSRTHKSYIPTGTLQPLLENVFKHNKTTEKLSVDICICVNNDYIIISNTKNNLNSVKNTLGTSINNLIERYRFVTDKKIEISNTENNFTISLPILKTEN